MNSHFQKNLAWLEAVSPQIYDQVITNQSTVLLQSNGTDYSLSVSSQCITDSLLADVQSYYEEAIHNPDGVSFPLINNPLYCNTSGFILSKIAGSTNPELLNYLPSLHLSDTEDLPNTGPVYRNIAFLGSLSLLPFLSNISTHDFNSATSIIIVESDISQWIVLMHFVDLATMVEQFKIKGLGIVLHFEPSFDDLKNRLIHHFNYINPFALHGIQIFRSPIFSAPLQEIYSWLHAEEGANQIVMGMLGFATDEFNQIQQSIFNSLHHTNRSSLAQIPSHDYKAVIVSSGPSLDSQTKELAQFQDQLFIIACGSALGALLRAGVKPDVVVLLERNQGVHELLVELLLEGHDFSDIILVGSITIDPLIPSLFKQWISFHRPHSGSASLFRSEQSSCLPIAGPQVMNAGIEIATFLGFKSLLLVGCDFGTSTKRSVRASLAFGTEEDFTSRDFSLAVKGNYGRTVFTSPDLMGTKILLEKILAHFADIKIFRIGEGVSLDLKSVTDIQSIEEIIGDFSCDCSAIRDLLIQSSDPARLDSELLEQVLKKSIDEVGTIVSDIKTLVESENQWTNKLSLSLSAYVSRVKALEYSSPRCLVVDIIAQPLFLSVQSIFRHCDVHDTSSWVNAKQTFFASLDIIESVLRLFATSQLRVLRLYPDDLPQWNLDWVRHAFLTARPE